MAGSLTILLGGIWLFNLLLAYAARMGGFRLPQSDNQRMALVFSISLALYFLPLVVGGVQLLRGSARTLWLLVLIGLTQVMSTVGLVNADTSSSRWPYLLCAAPLNAFDFIAVFALRRAIRLATPADPSRRPMAKIRLVAAILAFLNLAGGLYGVVISFEPLLLVPHNAEQVGELVGVGVELLISILFLVGGIRLLGDARRTALLLWLYRISAFLTVAIAFWVPSVLWEPLFWTRAALLVAGLVITLLARRQNRRTVEQTPSGAIR